MEKPLSIVLRFWSLSLSLIVVLFLAALYTGKMISVPGVSLFMSHENFQWGYEAMFASLNAVWAVYAWKASNNVSANRTFIAFTAWASISHGALMAFLSLMHTGEYADLLSGGLTLLGFGFILLFLNRTK